MKTAVNLNKPMKFMSNQFSFFNLLFPILCSAIYIIINKKKTTGLINILYQILQVIIISPQKQKIIIFSNINPYMKNRSILQADQLLKIEAYDNCPDLQLEFMDRIGQDQHDDLFLFDNNRSIEMELQRFYEEQPSVKIEQIRNQHQNSKQKAIEDTFHKQSSSVCQNNWSSSVQFPLQYLQTHVCLRTTPIQEIENFMLKDQMLSAFIKSPFSKKISKLIINKKRFLKRQRAKIRRQTFEHKQQPSNNSNKNEKQMLVIIQQAIKDNFNIEEDKKRRNRISAQVSRDKRKAYLTELQQNNKKLADQKDQIAKQNQKLKQQLQRLKNTNNTQIKQDKVFHKNKFVKVLIFMGIFFMINLFQNTLQKNQNSSHSAIVIQTEETYNKEAPMLNPILTEKLNNQIIEFESEQRREIMKQILSLMPDINCDKTSQLLNSDQDHISQFFYGKKIKEAKIKKSKSQKKKSQSDLKDFHEDTISSDYHRLYNIIIQQLMDEKKLRQKLYIPLKIYTQIKQTMNLIS